MGQNGTGSRLISNFLSLCRIPHGSGYTKQTAEYLLRFAEERGLFALMDETGNVLIRKPGQGEGAGKKSVLLQAHMDMVCVCDPSVSIDFLKDGIPVYEEDGYLAARGTSLGADDGIGEAFMMTLLEDPDLPHPPLECLFTVDEETGMDGAFGLDPSLIESRRLINLDSEGEGVFTTGCAGGGAARCVFPVVRKAYDGTAVRVIIEGLCGGHSGLEISRPRANADKLIGRLLLDATDRFDLRICDLFGGEKNNAIPDRAEAVVVLRPEDESSFKEFIKEEETVFRKEYAGSEEGLAVNAFRTDDPDVLPLTEESAEGILDFLVLAPFGVLKMNGFFPGTPETSVNLGIIKTDQDSFTAILMARSAVDSARHHVLSGIVRLSSLCGGSGSIEGDYPAWEYNDSSPLLSVMQDVFRMCYDGREASAVVTHGGLECGLFFKRIPGIDIVSIGPDTFDIHSPRERLSIASAERVYAFLCSVLKALP